MKFSKLYMRIFKTTSYTTWLFIFLTILFWYCGEDKIAQNCELMCLATVLTGLSVYILTEVFEFFYKRVL